MLSISLALVLTLIIYIFIDLLLGLFNTSQSPNLTTHIVIKISQFMHAPYIAHFQDVKQILCYIKCTIQFGLSMTRSSSPAPLAYLDVD